MSKSNNNNNNNKPKPAVITVEVSPELKAAYRTWWQKNGFMSESDAIRFHLRSTTGFEPSTAQPA